MFNPGPQAISKASRSWPPSLNQPQPLAGKPGGLRAGPACRAAAHQWIEQPGGRGRRLSSCVIPATAPSSHPSFPLSVLPTPFCLVPPLCLMSVTPGPTPRSLGSSDVGWTSLPPTLDIQAVLRETRKNRQDVDDKYKKWKKERKNYLFSSSEAHLYPRPPLQIETLKIIFIFYFLLWFCKNAERQEIKVTGRYIFYGTWKIVVIPSL